MHNFYNDYYLKFGCHLKYIILSIISVPQFILLCFLCCDILSDDLYKIKHSEYLKAVFIIQVLYMWNVRMAAF